MSSKTVSAISPFQIAVPQSQIDLVHQKLALATFPDELKNAERDYGAPLDDIKRLVGRWQTGFDWRAQEAKINAELPQFTMDIDVDGFEKLNIHFVHKRSTSRKAIPLLFVHGWPGSFLEVRKILPLLTQTSPAFPSFHVVALSLPGYGFSEAPTLRGFSMPQYAELGNKLMNALGYKKYVTQGGDWGAMVIRTMGLLYGGKHVVACHTNFPQGVEPTLFKNPLLYVQHRLTPYSKEEKESIKRTALFQENGRGYYAEQSTQPQTLGYSLADSPVGLLAWIYEKLVNWTDNYAWEDDEVLTWVSIYLFSRAGPAASLRIYYEVTHNNDAQKVYGQRLSVPTGISTFPKELRTSPNVWYHVLSNIVFVSQHTSGGHFAAHEKPEELVDDLRRMFGRKGPCADVVRQTKAKL
ncbi:alpha/beta-hydrolase [Cylindrobasidium torrendii FP15055 ss-10]|uniref:Alpha/beta-hydrolase n=1 Tax=Cylindrobasidium torrendii FP15055 ss-10 TaxID=1314674 RepID=A0A0D7B995_9AGAR|nr:alpha/beta-hydrolase [Cylindrobasidium torrendii FP15055 ss-10]